jgi:hypothetical protein
MIIVHEFHYMEKKFHTKFVDVFLISQRTKFHMPSYNTQNQELMIQFHITKASFSFCETVNRKLAYNFDAHNNVIHKKLQPLILQCTGAASGQYIFYPTLHFISTQQNHFNLCMIKCMLTF